MSDSKEKHSTLDQRERHSTYLDANATTFMSQDVITFMAKWTNKGDSTAHYQSALDCKKLISSFKEQIAIECGFESSEFKIIITSSASEANCLFIRTCIQSYSAITGILPHIIISNEEHDSITKYCEDLLANNLCQLSILSNLESHILESEIRSNTCFISITASNANSGVIHNLRELTLMAKKAKVPFHTDVVQLFSRSVFRPLFAGVDAFTANFHKMHGPSGIGILVISKRLIDGYKLKFSTYNIENIPAIAGAFLSFKQMTENRSEKNANLLRMKKILIEAISNKVETCYVEDLTENSRIEDNNITWYFPKDLSLSLPNTILFSCIDYGENSLITILEENNIIVKFDRKLKLIRISFSDNTSIEDIKHIIKIILKYTRS